MLPSWVERLGFKKYYLNFAIDIPFLLIDLSAAAVMRRVTQRFSSARKIRFLVKFGSQRRLVAFFAWDTLFPVLGSAPVKEHLLAIGNLLKIKSGES